DQLIEPRHDGMESVVAAHRVIERLLRLCHGTIVPVWAEKTPVSRSRHRMFTGLTCGHEPICYAIDPNPWWTVGRRTYGAAQEESRPPAPGSRGGFIRPRGTARPIAGAAQRRNPSTEYHPRRLHLGAPSCAASKFHLRTVDRSADEAGGHHADVRKGNGRARRPGRTGHPLR